MLIVSVEAMRRGFFGTRASYGGIVYLSKKSIQNAVARAPYMT